MVLDLSSLFGFNTPIDKKTQGQVNKEDYLNYPSTYDPEMKKWGPTIIEVYKNIKNGKF